MASSPGDGGGTRPPEPTAAADGVPAADRGTAERLASAPLEVVGRFSDASNATLLVRLGDRDPRTLADLADGLGRPAGLEDLDPRDLAVYKPERGEAPLWDFPTGTLHRREVAAYEVSVALGWDLVPVTVLREDAPFGPGSLQRFVPHDPDEHYFWLLEHGGPEVAVQLTRMVTFDLVIDNADRKGGHVLRELPPGSGPLGPAAASVPAEGTPIRLVDHGVSFHVEDKLRTVGWHLAGAPVPDADRARVADLEAQLAGWLGQRLAALLVDAEIDALRRRVQSLADLERFPPPSGPRPTPWPVL